MSDLLCKDDDVPINNNSAMDNPGWIDNDGKRALEIDCVTESLPLPSQRNSPRTRFGSKTQTKKTSRKCKNKDSTVAHPVVVKKINLEAARKKRSCFSKPARSSVRGLLENVKQSFEQDNELGVSESMCQGMGKTRNKRQSGKAIKNGASSSLSVNVSNLDMLPAVGLGEQHLSPRNAWVRCEDSHKRRRIPAVLADQIDETNCTWTCNDSSDKSFDDCAIPQEMSNAEIYKELGLSDASGEEVAYEDSKAYKELEYQLPLGMGKTRNKRQSGKAIKNGASSSSSVNVSNLDMLLAVGLGEQHLSPRNAWVRCEDSHKRRRIPALLADQIDETNCTWTCNDSSDKSFDDCAIPQEMSNAEIYKELGLSDASGEEDAYEDSKAYKELEYQLPLEKESSVNPASTVSLCQGMGKTRDKRQSGKAIKNGASSSSSVNASNLDMLPAVGLGEQHLSPRNAWVRCDDSHKRLRIPVVLADQIDETNCTWTCKDSSDKSFDDCAIPQEMSNAEIYKELGLLDTSGEEDAYEDSKAYKELEYQLPLEKESSVNPASAVSLLQSSVEVDSKDKLPSSIRAERISQQMDDETSKPVSDVQGGYTMESEFVDKTSSVQRLDTTSPLTTVSKVLSNSIGSSNRESKSETVEGMNDFSQSHLPVKTPQKNRSVKKGKVRANPLNGLKPEVTANRMQLSSIKHKKVVESSSNGRFEAVQEKLDELLDGDGGISKRKDATKGYLKLLLLSGASGDRINGEAIQSNRDLSMILDALLKTKSRAVLNDIINKNGLQMLHNIMKQYRQDFKKIPILRKLLKVLEYLATSKILTSEHINGGPPCQGMESFGESMLSLTEHDDKQVHQIARNFRDRWIRRPVRKHGYMDRDDSRVEYHRSFNCNRFSASHNHRHDQDAIPTQAIDCGQQSMLVTTSVDAGAQEDCSAPSLAGAKNRKRKSRWDQPAETNSPFDAVISSINESQNIPQDDMILSTTGANPEDMNHPCEDNKHIAKRLKEDSSDLGRRYVRQQKWNNSKIH